MNDGGNSDEIPDEKYVSTPKPRHIRYHSRPDDCPHVKNYRAQTDNEYLYHQPKHCSWCSDTDRQAAPPKPSLRSLIEDGEIDVGAGAIGDGGEDTNDESDQR